MMMPLDLYHLTCRFLHVIVHVNKLKDLKSFLFTLMQFCGVFREKTCFNPLSNKLLLKKL